MSESLVIGHNIKCSAEEVLDLLIVKMPLEIQLLSSY